MKIYIDKLNGSYYWLESNVLICSPIYQGNHILNTEQQEDMAEVDFDNISKEEQEYCRTIFEKLGGKV